MLHLNVTWDPAKTKNNSAKHGVNFAQAAAVLLDPLALIVFDEAHSEHEERRLTLGASSDGALLAIAHTYQSTSTNRARVRIISARYATRRERVQYQQLPR